MNTNENIPLSPSARRSRINCCPAQENDGLRVILFCFGVLCICVTIALVISIHLGEPEFPPRGAVATDSQQCSQIGVDVLKKGGSAMDAAVASTLCMCVVNPHIASIGGGGAMIVVDHKANKPPSVINFQDAAPTNFVNTSLVGVPGLLKGLWEGHKKFGRLEWAQLVQPAIDLSLRGFNVSSQLAFAVQSLPEDSPLRRSALFFPKGIPLAEGQVIRLSGLAGVLQSVAQNGVSEFYNGTAATRLVDFMKRSGGAEWTLADLTGYQARTEPAISGTYNRTTIYTTSAPTAGPQLISMLNILGSDHPGRMEQFSLHHLHQLIETMRITQNQITKLGDPQFDPEVNVTIASMLNRTLAEQVAQQIRPDAILPDTNAPSLTPGAAASVVTVMDNQDNYVSLVTGLNSMFGSHLESPDGYLLNDALAGFFPDPSLPNSLRHPGQRPLQSFAPAIGTETAGRCGVRFIAGSSDATLLGQVVLNVVQFNQSAFEAVRAARLRTQAQSHVLTLEDSVQVKLPDEVVAELIKMGHTVKAVRPPYPSINVVLKNGDSLSSESDGRGGGHSVKYGPA